MKKSITNYYKMKMLFSRFFYCTIIVAISFFSACNQKRNVQDSEEGSMKFEWYELSVEAPFEMPDIRVPLFPERVFNIKDYGAKANGVEKNTEAIRQTIEACFNAGGGQVLIPAGKWLTGKIHLKSNINLHVSEGAELIFSFFSQDYLPAVQSKWEGVECYNYSPLIYAFECTNVAITGKGKLKAKMGVWKTWFTRPKPHMDALIRLYHMGAKGVPVQERQMVGENAHLRPQFIQFNDCENILLQDISIENSPFWVIHPFKSINVVIRNVKVKAHGHNNDGVDPEMSQNMLIENCVFDQGDDAIAVKSGRNQDAWRLNTPSKNIVIRNCTIENGHQLLAIGSELSGGVENIFMDNCNISSEAGEIKYDAEDPEEKSLLNNIIFIKTNERRGGYVRKIYMSNIEAGQIKRGVLGIETDVLYQWRDIVPTYERRLTSIENIYLENISATNAEFVSKISGQEALPVNGIFIKNVSVDNIQSEKFIHENVEGFSFTE